MTQHLDAISIGKTYRTKMIPCEACGHSGFEALQSRGRIAEAGTYGDLRVVVCNSCGFKLINPRYEDRFYQDYYERLYREVAFGDTRPSERYLSEQKARGAGVLRYAQSFSIPPGRMLDHGCASAATSLAWRDAGWEVKGMDPHRPSIELGREIFGFDLAVAAGESLPYPDRSFDLVLSLGSLEHVYNLAATMGELRRVLISGGVLLIRWRTEAMFGSPLEYYNHNHYRFFSSNTWRLVLRRYGFEILDMDDRKHEGFPNYSYIMARSTLEPSTDEVEAMRLAGVRDNAGMIQAQLKSYREEFRRRSEAFLSVAGRFEGRPEALIDAVRNGACDWTMLSGDPAWAVARAILEARRYIEEYDAGRVM